jgi:glycine dehydrogenase
VSTSRSPGVEARIFLASDRCFPQTLEVLKSRAEPLGIELKILPKDEMEFQPGVFGVLLQYPDERGALEDLSTFIARAHEHGVLVAVATDLLALALFKPPGEMGRTSWSAIRSDSGFPSASAGRMPRSSPRAMPMSGRCPAG